MLRKLITVAAVLMLMTLLAAPLVLAQQEVPPVSDNPISITQDPPTSIPGFDPALLSPEDRKYYIVVDNVAINCKVVPEDSPNLDLCLEHGITPLEITDREDSNLAGFNQYASG